MDIEEIKKTIYKKSVKFRCYMNCRIEYDLHKFVQPNKLSDFPYLMQFIGIVDKNGKEIFEGDIIKSPFNKFDDVVGVVIVRNGHTMLLHQNGEDEKEVFLLQGDGIEVLGNIFENQDFFKK